MALNASAAALSAELPIAAMDLRTPACVQAAANAFAVYCDRWSVWKIAPARLPRERSASVSASRTGSVRMWSAIANPASRLAHRSMTVAGYSGRPPATGRYVISPT